MTAAKVNVMGCSVARCALLAILLSLTGCSSSEPLYEVKGKVQRGGQPMVVQEMRSGAGGRVMVLLHGVDPGEKYQGPYGAIVKSDGTFSVPGPTGKGIPPGKYRVEITWQDPFPMGNDKLGGKFGRDNSPVEVDVPTEGDIDIDVATAGG